MPEFLLTHVVNMSAVSEPHHGHEEHGEATEVIYFFALALLLGAGTMHFLTRFLPALPYTVVLLVEGIGLGVLHDVTKAGSGHGDRLGAFNRSMARWAGIDPEVLLYTFLPALLFGECMTLRWHIVRKTLGQCLTLAGPGVLVGCFLTAAFAKVILPYGWTLFQCLTFGAIMAATDPVAVVAILKELGASPKLTMIISGEALLNDGTAIVLTKLFMAMALREANINADALHDIGLPAGQEEVGVGFVLQFFFQMAICAVLWGAFTGLVTTFLVAWAGQRTSHADTTIQIALTICCAYLTFFIGDHLLGVSGVLATVVAGVVVSAFCWPLFNSKETMEHVWHMFEWLGNTLIFILAGLIIGFGFADRSQFLSASDVGWLFLLYFAMNIIRFLMIGCFFPVLKCMGYGVTWQECIVMSYGGLRGAVGLALALDVDLEFNADGNSEASKRYGTKLLFMVGGIALLTCCINGTTSSMLLKCLGMTKSDKGKEKILSEIRRRVATHCQDTFDGEISKLQGFSDSNRRKVVARITALNPSADIHTSPSAGTHILTSTAFGFVKQNAVREFFLQAVQCAYAQQVERGVLRQDGPQEIILRSSLEFALDHIQDGLKDIEYVLDYLKKPTGCAAASRKLLACLTGALSYHEHYSVVALHERTCVYILTCFIKAHREAQYVTLHFLGEDEAATAAEKEETIRESQEAVLEAQNALEKLPQDLKEDAVVQQVCAVVLDSERRFIEHLENTGVVDAKQAHTLLHQVAHDMALVRRGERDMHESRLRRAATEVLDEAEPVRPTTPLKIVSDLNRTDAARTYQRTGSMELS
jgi:NhaP-type Na+/H+ or K+/H+ antiporter